MEIVITVIVSTLMCSILLGEGQETIIETEEAKDTAQQENVEINESFVEHDVIRFESVRLGLMKNNLSGIFRIDNIPCSVKAASFGNSF